MLEKKFKSNIEDIQKCRYEIFNAQNDNFLKKVSLGRDFNTVSSVRDLIFQKQEHCFSIPEIIKILIKFKLKFLGFLIQILKTSTQKFIVMIKKTFYLKIGLVLKKIIRTCLIRCIIFG